MSNITVLTPAYNRGKLLQKLYKSLCDQDCKDFEWLIVDDGSSDGTEDYVKKMKETADFPISYYKKENGGKHTALNYAYQEEQDVCGFSFLRGKPGGGYLSTSGVPQDGMKESYVDCRINRSIGGDMAEVWYTHCLKEYPFPKFTGEKFLGEDIVWVRMSEKYKMRFFNRVIYISDYLEDGLTNNRRKHNIKSPNGCVARAEAFLDSNVCMKIRIKSMLQYQIYGRFAGRSGELFKDSKDKILYCTLFMPSLVLYKIWKRKMENPA